MQAGVGLKRDSEEEVGGCCIKTNSGFLSFLSHSNSRTPFGCLLLSCYRSPIVQTSFFSHAMIGRRRRRWRVIKPFGRSIDRQHRFGLKRDNDGDGVILIRPGSRPRPRPSPSPSSSSRRPRPTNVSECRSPEAPLADDDVGGDSNGVCAAADRLTGLLLATRRRWTTTVLLLSVLFAGLLDAATAVIAATESRFRRRRRPQRALGASVVCRTTAAFSDLQSEVGANIKQVKWQRRRWRRSS